MKPLEGQMPGTPSPETISTRRQRIAELARRSPQAALTTLAHHIDIDWLKEAYRRTRKDGAVGALGRASGLPAAPIAPFFLGHGNAARVQCEFRRAGRGPG
jgi:hypothetical protein